MHEHKHSDQSYSLRRRRSSSPAHPAAEGATASNTNKLTAKCVWSRVCVWKGPSHTLPLIAQTLHIAECWVRVTGKHTETNSNDSHTFWLMALFSCAAFANFVFIPNSPSEKLCQPSVVMEIHRFVYNKVWGLWIISLVYSYKWATEGGDKYGDTQ